MGLRCECPQGHVLNVKQELAGKVGICPHCNSRFLIEESAPNINKEDTAAEASGIVATEPPKIHEAEPSVSEPPNTDSIEATEWRLASPSGEHYGPTVPTLFAQWIIQGRVPSDWLVWRTGWAEWKVASEAESELPAPLPKETSSDTPPPISNEMLAKKAKPSKPNQTISTSPKDKYTQRKKRNAFRQKVIIGMLGLVAIILVVSLMFLMGGE